MQGMETAYVGNGVSAENASTTVGTEVIKAVAQKYQTNNQIGKATIEIDGFGTIDNVERDATVSVYTTDFEVIGTITLDDGILTWGEIEENVLPVVSRVELNPTTLEIEQDDSDIVEVKCYNSDNKIIPLRKLGEISIERKSGSSKITVTKDTTYKNKAKINVAEDEEVGNEKAIITAIVDGVEALQENRCKINVKKKTPIIGQYVDYAVSYKDIFTDYVFGNVIDETTGERAVNAWRILDPGTKSIVNGVVEYTGTKIVSTGVPVNLNYNSGTTGTWWGNTGNTGEKVAYGMKYNYKSIPIIMNTTPVANKLGYKLITNSDPVTGITNTTNASIFITSKAIINDDTATTGATEIESVHVLTLEELNIAREVATTSNMLISKKDGAKGLFCLINLVNENSAYLYTRNTVCNYWLANPNGTNEVKYVKMDVNNGFAGNLESYKDLTRGIRPVITLNSNIYKDGDIWRIR